MTDFLPDIPFSSLQYTLSEDRIAVRPLDQRDASRLLVYNGSISDHVFSELPDILPQNALLIGNDTRVIPARIHFHISTGAVVEIFLLEPLNAQWTIWRVMVGNRKKFRDGDVLSAEAGDKNKVGLKAMWYHREAGIVRLEPDEGMTMHEAIDVFGKIPLPPYIRREADEEDRSRYQTVFGQVPGAVAAPTASLHFSEPLMEELSIRGYGPGFITLHVSAGTFKPVTADSTRGHVMHHEHYTVSLQLLETVAAALRDGRCIIPIGTTSMRVLESLYYIGSNLLMKLPRPFDIRPEAGYNPIYGRFTTEEAISALHSYAQKEEGSVSGVTSIFILPGFTFRISGGIITNFHQPGSTLIALVAAFLGEDWKKVYAHALERGYRFLSYGDSSLLLPRSK